MPDENGPKKRVDFPRDLYESLVNMLFAISKDNSMDDRYKRVSEQVIKLFADCQPTARKQTNRQVADSPQTDQQPVSQQPNQQRNGV